MPDSHAHERAGCTASSLFRRSKSPNLGPEIRSVTKQEIKAAILGCARKLKRAPTLRELGANTRVTHYDVIRTFGTYLCALNECKLKKTGSGMMLSMEQLFHDWARVVRAIKRIPMLYEYQRHGHYSQRPFVKRFGPWRNVPEAMKLYAVDHRLVDDWRDVIALIDGYVECKNGNQPETALLPHPVISPNRPFYGRLLRPFPLVCAPTNEAGVIFLFGAMAQQLGFQMLRIQSDYPDGEALRTVSGDRLQRVTIEFEFESRNFLRHGHNAAKCDLIVCWENNWADAPLEVIELKTEIQKL